MQEQKPNIVLIHIEQRGLPSIKMLAEAGLVGKIGFNSSGNFHALDVLETELIYVGVGVCCNAIRAKGMNPTRLPMHLALRMALNSASMEEAVKKLKEFGVASSCHILVGDKTGAIGMEWSHLGLESIPLTDDRIHHANHLLLDHTDIVDTQWLPDSLNRVDRIQQLSRSVSTPTIGSIQEIFKDENNLPGAICRRQEGDSTAATLFNIVMDLAAVRAEVIMGRPTEPEENLSLYF